MTWKLSMPSAENWQQLTDQLDVAEPDPEGKVTIKGDGVGMRWKFDEDMLERVASVLGVVFSIRVGDPREFIEGYGGLTYAKLEFHHLPMLEDEKSPGTFGYDISVYPMLSPEAANFSIWHEIQHIFQFEEKRADPMKLNYNPNLPMMGENVDKYRKDPSELDADQMALKLHELGQYPVVRTIPLLEGTEGAEYAQLVNEEGWPPGEALEWVKEYVKTDEVPLSTVMTTRGLDDLQAPTSKVAMPYFNNTWYHVTSVDNLDNIAKQGLQPRAEGGQSTNWPKAPVAENAVYLWPTVSMARSYFGMLPFKQKEVILRVANIEQAKLAPDHETFASWLGNQYEQYKEEMPGNPEGAYGGNQLYEEITKASPTMHQYIQELDDDDTFIDISPEDSLHILAEIPPQLRVEMVKYFGESDPSAPAMYYGSIPPENISVAALVTLEQLQEQFDEETQHPYITEWEGHSPEEYEKLEQDYHEKLEEYLVNVMDERQIREFIGLDDIEKIIENSYDDSQDEFADNFMYKPVNQWKSLIPPTNTIPAYGEPKHDVPQWVRGVF